MPSRYVKNPHTAGRVIEGRAFIVTAGDNKLHTLNATAATLWELAQRQEGFTAEEGATALTKAFRVEYERALADCRVCIEDLLARGILEASES